VSKERKTVYVLSLGQLLESDINRSIQAFTTLLREKGKWFPGLRVKGALLWDRLAGHTIDAYKTGSIDTDIFRQRMKASLGISTSCTDQEFDEAWNKMVTIEDIQKQSITGLFEKINEKPNTYLVIASDTNPLHVAAFQKRMDYTAEQLAEMDRIKFGLSYEQGTLNRHTLALPLLEKLGFQPGDTVTSLHRDIRQTGQLGLPEGITFNHTPYSATPLRPTTCELLEKLNPHRLSRISTSQINMLASTPSSPLSELSSNDPATVLLSPSSLQTASTHSR
jgi:hypothetical protein